MENKLSNQDKLKVFALYMNSNVIVEKSCYWLVHEKLIHKDTVKQLNTGMLDVVYRTFDDAEIKLLLTPLESIRDEHTVEVACLEFPMQRKEGNISDTDLAKHIKEEHLPDVNVDVILNYTTYQQLILWGYAVPLYFGLDHWANGKTAIELGIAIPTPSNK